MATKVSRGDKSLTLRTSLLSSSAEKGFDLFVGDGNTWIPVEVKQKNQLSGFDIAGFRTGFETP